MGEILLLASDVPDDLAEFFEADEADMTDVLRISTKPYKEAHFATFPVALVEPCVLAGTSARGACGKCGAPWRRTLTKVGEQQTRWAKTNALAAEVGGTHRERTHQDIHETTGWQPTCDCNAGEPTPCTVLDPFSGAASAGLAALRHGRHYIGIDLNSDYVAMAERRLGLVKEAAVA